MQENMTKEDYDQIRALRWWHKMNLGDYQGVKVITQGECDNRYLTQYIDSAIIEGKKVADIGGWDGLFSFYCEKAGAAKVVNMDCSREEGGNWAERGDRDYTPKTFDLAKRLLRSKVEYRNFDLQASLSKDIEQFDTLICFGVLYHLTNPIKGIHNLCKMLADGGTILLETAMNPYDNKSALWELFRNKENDPTNFFYPNMYALTETFNLFGSYSVENLWYADGAVRGMFRITKR